MKGFFMYFINILSEPAFLVGMVTLIGLAVQKKKISTIVSATIKTMVGFLLITTGAQSMGMSLMPLQSMLQHIFGMNAQVASIDSAVGQGLSSFGSEAALIFAFGFFTNVLIARFTRFKYIHLSAHVSFFYAGLIAALLKVGTSLSPLMVIILGSLMLGIYLTLTCAYMNPLMKNVKGGEGFTIAHSSSIGCLIAAGLGKVFGNKNKDLESMKLPKGLEFLRETTIALSVLMTIIFLIVY